jgi:hypothetical protein
LAGAGKMTKLEAEKPKNVDAIQVYKQTGISVCLTRYRSVVAETGIITILAANIQKADVTYLA